MQHQGNWFPDQGSRAPCIWSAEFQSLDHQGKCASPMFLFVPQNCFSFGHWAPFELTALCGSPLAVVSFWFGLVFRHLLPFQHLLYFLAFLLQSVVFPRNPGSFLLDNVTKATSGYKMCSLLLESHCFSALQADRARRLCLSPYICASI